MPAERTASLAATVAEQAAAAPRQPWLEAAGSDRVVERGELATLTEQWARQGVAGRRVALLAADPVAFGALFVALIASGATVVPLDPDAPVEAIRPLVRASLPECAVVPGDGPAPPGVAGVLRASAATLLPEAPRSDVLGSRTTGGCLLFSSGSTGPRKAMRLNESQLLRVARAVAGAHELTARDRGFNPLPLVHVNGEVVGLLAPLVSGGTVVLDDRFHRTQFWDLVAGRSVTWVNAVPAIITILAHDDAGPTPPTVRFVRSASAPLPVPVLARFEARYGIPVIESYGMTEAASQITTNPLSGRRPGTVGRPVGVELRVVDDGGHDAPTGEVGRVLVRGPSVIRRYEDGASLDRFDANGWLDTGDLGSLDVCGFLTLAGRVADVINRGGEKIFPREVEEVLSGHPNVAEAIVTARSDPVLGEVPVAYVVAIGDEPATLRRQLSERCARSLPRAHRPAEIRLVPELPHGPTGKPIRRLVAAEVGL